MTWSLEGKTAIVTGASTGIGTETAIGIAQAGAHVIMTARDERKGEAALAYARARSGKGSVELMMCDFAWLESIRRFADDFKTKHNQLNVLVNNAGAINADRQETADGFEMTFGVNHLGYFLLTNLLLDLLKKSAPARVINVASRAHQRAELDFDDLQAEQKYSAMTVYSRSKLANILFTYELARRLEGTGVTANALHPGVVRSGFGKNNDGWAKGVFVAFQAVGRPFLKDNAAGAKTSIYLATSPDVEGVTGKYFSESKETASNAASHDVDAQKRLWEISERLCGLNATSA
jgi:NAD(P)-dependent dehydrogenase (short-subunit alcohol dehydrogenase family)